LQVFGITAKNSDETAKGSLLFLSSKPLPVEDFRKDFAMCFADNLLQITAKTAKTAHQRTNRGLLRTNPERVQASHGPSVCAPMFA
jgi:hypothetical protein